MPSFGNNNRSGGNNWPGMNFGSTPTPYSGYNMPTWGMPYPTYPAQPLYYYYPVPMQQQQQQQQPVPVQQAAPVAPSAPTTPVQAVTTHPSSVTPAPVAAETITPSVDTKGVEK